MSDVYAVAVARFYEDLAERLVEGAVRVFQEAGADSEVHDEQIQDRERDRR